MRVPTLAAIVLLPLALAGCVDPPAATVETAAAPPLDAPGTLAFANGTYDFGVLVAQSPTFRQPSLVRVHGQAYVPTDAEGPFPVVVLMHGNHFTCRGKLTPSVSVGTCADTPLWTVERSHEGYGPLAEDLAARGFVVLSINANDVNDNNALDDLGANQRGQLFLRTLDELRAANEGKGPMGGQLQGKLDLARVGIMGHSRGGDGAARATVLNAERPDAERHEILAVFALAPTDFVRHLVRGVAFATLLPYCDGDVQSLHGAWMYDDARLLDDAGPLHQIVVHGANHNWFNGVWYQDDAGWRKDPECKPGAATRLAREDQMALGVRYMGGFFRRYLADETTLDPLLQEEAPRVLVSHQPPTRLLLDAAAAEGTNALGGKVVAEGFQDARLCETTASKGGRTPLALLDLAPREPGTCPSEPIASTATLRALAWSGPATLREELPGVDATPHAALTLRVSNDLDAAAPLDVRVTLRDGAGREATVPLAAWTRALDPPPGDDRSAKITLNAARAPLSAFEGVDLRDVREIRLAFEGEGRAYLTDLMLA